MGNLPAGGVILKDPIKIKVLETDFLIIGGGAAGCLAAVKAKDIQNNLDVMILEKANIMRSGCLASGLNAINAYINPGESPESFVKYVRKDSMGLMREDLVLSLAKRLNELVKLVESWGLSINKNENGDYVKRGRWNIEIEGEAIKPIIARKTKESGVNIINRVLATNLLVKNNRVYGAFAFDIRKGIFYYIRAKAVLIATGGASGIYRPQNNGSAQHKTWYSPFNTGAGYAMGIRAGAEMTSFEMRFIALRVKDIIAPTGTMALGFKANQINSYGEKYMVKRYNHFGGDRAPTPLRINGPITELKEGRGPVFLDLTHLSSEKIKKLKEVYLNMYPGLVLYWAANNFDPGEKPVEIQGTEPYIVGGHAGAGYWINEKRETTIEGLYAAGDVAGGAPYKFVSGSWAEGVIAAENAIKYILRYKDLDIINEIKFNEEIKRVYHPFYINEGISANDMEERLQKIMDEYAGGISKYYEMNDKELKLGLEKIMSLKKQIKYLKADNFHELMNCHEVIDRIDVARVLIHHLLYRKETRWPIYQTRTDYPDRDDENWLKFVNSKLINDSIVIYERPYKKIV